MSEPEKPKSEPLPSLRQLQRLGRNVNGYLGETINIAAVLNDCARAAAETGWDAEEVQVTAGVNLLVFRRAPGMNPRPGNAPTAKRVYVSAGIHGDEPAGPLAALQLLQEGSIPAELD
ncbi:MAG: hypothetical protein ACREIC_14170, partial [Limisphaerales bacterium]